MEQRHSGLCMRAAVRSVPSLELRSHRVSPKQHLITGTGVVLEATAQDLTVDHPCMAANCRRCFRCPPVDLWIDMARTTSSPAYLASPGCKKTTEILYVCRVTGLTGRSRVLQHRGMSQVRLDMVLQSQQGMTNSSSLLRHMEHLTA